MLKKITKTGFLCVRIMTSVIAAIFIVYSLFTLWDMYKTEINAFASYDLLKYRPNIENEEPPYLDDLLKINPDTAGWVTVYGTNIDYPVMQGKTDMEYVNKTATKEYSQSGSIFLSVLNKKDFSDPYNLLYGHHMENGSMFGDLDKFSKKAFFYNKKQCRFKDEEGVLIMQEKVYNLKVFAFINTTAYDNNIYRADKTELGPFLSYAKEKSKFWIDPGKTEKILALSTCHDATTEGRSIVLCKMERRTTPLPTREAEPLTPHRKAIGHPMAGAYWAVLNLIIMLLSIYTAFPVHLLFSKEKQHVEANFKYCDKVKIFKDKKKNRLLLLLLSAISFILFWMTENLQKPIQIIDRWTPVMFVILLVIWLIKIKQGKDLPNDNQ